jgi:hypothetical protein
MSQTQVQYIRNMEGKPIAVVLPIEFWRSVFPMDETQYLNSSEKMRQRLLESLGRDEGYSLEEVHEKLGI